MKEKTGEGKCKKWGLWLASKLCIFVFLKKLSNMHDENNYNM